MVSRHQSDQGRTSWRFDFFQKNFNVSLKFRISFSKNLAINSRRKLMIWWLNSQWASRCSVNSGGVQNFDIHFEIDLLEAEKNISADESILFPMRELVSERQSGVRSLEQLVTNCSLQRTCFAFIWLSEGTVFFSAWVLLACIVSFQAAALGRASRPCVFFANHILDKRFRPRL